MRERIFYLLLMLSVCACIAAIGMILYTEFSTWDQLRTKRDQFFDNAQALCLFAIGFGLYWIAAYIDPDEVKK